MNHFQMIQIIQEANHLITLVIEVDHKNKEIHKISHKTNIVDQIVKIISIKTTIHDSIQTEENIRLIPVPIQILGKDTIETIDHDIHHTIGSRNFSNNRNTIYSNNQNQRYRNNRSRNNSYNRSNYQRTNNIYHRRSQNNSQNRNPS